MWLWFPNSIFYGVLQDVLRARVKTTGIIETQFTFKGLYFKTFAQCNPSYSNPCDLTSFFGNLKIDFRFLFRTFCAQESRRRVSLKPNSHTKVYISKCLTLVAKDPREKNGSTVLKEWQQLFFVLLSVVMIWFWPKMKKWIVWWNLWSYLTLFATTNGLSKLPSFFFWTRKTCLSKRSSTVHCPFASQNTKVGFHNKGHSITTGTRKRGRGQ